MSHLWNLLRDQTHVQPTTDAGPGWRGQNAQPDNSIFCLTTGIVAQEFGTVMQALSIEGGAEWYASGMLISQPSIDATPYRVKVRVLSEMAAFVFVGYAPDAPTGNDLITKCTFLPVCSQDNDHIGEFDEVLRMPGLQVTNSDANKPLCFGVAVRNKNNANAAFHMSVQNLARTPPTFSSSTS